jgi:hypothetical protein
VIPQALSSEISEIKGRLRHRAKKYHESIAAWRVDPKSSMGSKPDYFDSSTWEKPFVCDHIWKNINIEDIRGKYFKHYEEDSEDPRSWGAWRFYSPCRITGDTIEIDGKVISKILQSTGFESVDDFNSHVGSYPNNCLPDSLQQRLLTIFKKPTCTENDLPNRFTINLPDQGYDSKASGTTKTVIIESPFCLAKDPAGIEISIGSMQIEQHDGGKFAVVIRAGVTCASLFESRNDELGEACRVLIDGLAMGEPCEIGDEDRDVLQAFLEAQGIDQCLAYNPDFLDELGMAVRFMAESIGISTIAFVDAEGNTEELYLDGDEEIGFTSLF